MDINTESLNIQGPYRVHQSRRLNEERRRRQQNETSDDEKKKRTEDVVDMSKPEAAESDSVNPNSESRDNTSDSERHTINILVK